MEFMKIMKRSGPGPENGSLRNSGCYVGAVGGEVIKNHSLTSAREIVSKPPQEGTSYADAS